MEEQTPKPKTQRNVPKADKDFDTLVNNVSQKWEQNDWLTLLWLTQAEFATQAASFTTKLDSKTMVASGRGGVSGQLVKLDKKIDKGESFIKSYLKEKYEDGYEDHYTAFGIVRVGDSLTIPHDRDARKKALKLILPALATFGFETKTYGLTYWQDIATQYPLLVSQASAKDGSTAKDVGAKNVHKAFLKKGLNALILSIKANFPDTWKQELRDWGFQKEKY